MIMIANVSPKKKIVMPVMFIVGGPCKGLL